MARSIENFPTQDTTEPSPWAGKDRVYENRAVLVTDEGEEVVVVDYRQDAGLYVVINADGSGPHYRLSPDALHPKEDGVEG